MRRGRLQAARSATVGAMLALSLCTAHQAVVPTSASAQVNPPNLAASFNNTGISDDTNTTQANFDRNGYSLSRQALADVGVKGGSTITAGVMSFTWPDVAPGQPDNIVASGQTIALRGTGTTFGVLATATYANSAPASGTFTVHYTDGSYTAGPISIRDWYAPTGTGGTPVIHPAYRNTPGGTKDYPVSPHIVQVFYATLPLQSGRIVQSVTLPNVSVPQPDAHTTAMHIFAMAIAPWLPTSYPTKLAVGRTHACAIVSSTPYCWGSNSNGETGNDPSTRSSPVTDWNLPLWVNTASPPAGTMNQITAGDRFTCALYSVNVPYCWGKNLKGQLGTGTDDVSEKHLPTAVYGSPAFNQISASASAAAGTGEHTCAIGTSDSKAYCWGDNTDGQLGTGDTPGATVPQPVTTTGTPMTGTVTRISANGHHTCALSRAQAFCWGDNTYGQIGGSVGTGSNVPAAMDTTGVLAGATLTEIAAGDTHTCALDAFGQAYCWGSNVSGQLGCGTYDPTDNPTCPPATTSPPSGTTNYSSVPVAVVLPAGVVMTQITAGSGYTCALGNNGRAYCWGQGSYGQLGDGTDISSPVPVQVDTPAGAPLTQIDAGTYTACAMNTAERVFCWGGNFHGEAGQGTSGVQYSPVAVIGYLTITVPDEVDLSDATPGGIASGPVANDELGGVTVSDTRMPGTGGWVASVQITNFDLAQTTTGATARTCPTGVVCEIGADQATYIIPGTPEEDSIESRPGAAITNKALPPLGVNLGSEEEVVNAASGANGETTWTPTISVDVPFGAAAGEYTATITHSVA